MSNVSFKKRRRTFTEFMEDSTLPFKKRVITLWTKIPDTSRDSLFKSLSYLLNFLVNALLLSIPLTVTGYLVFNVFSVKIYFLVVLSLWVLIPFMEHYYVWFKERWKDELQK